MQYKKIVSGETVIEFHNNWLGEETVIVNGQIVSKEYSVWGTNHYFTVMEDGHHARYILTTKVDANLQVVLDLSRNGLLVEENIPVKYSSQLGIPKNRTKQAAITKLNNYDLEEAIDEFKKALKENPKDAEIYFYLACAYSVLERTDEGFDALKTAVANGLPDQEMILNHDMLAFLRMHPAFEAFLNSGFTSYDKNDLGDV